MKRIAIVCLVFLVVLGCKKILLLDSYISVKRELLNSPTSTALNAVHFISTSVGVIAGEGGKIYKTSNGGSNWTNISLGSDRDVYSVYFHHTDTGFIGTEGGLYGTNDGGQSWNYLASGRFNGIDFGSSTVGYAAVGLELDDGTIYKTTNRGQSWYELSMVSWPSWVSGMFDVSFYDADHGMGVGMGGVNMYTSDGGASWNGYPNGHPSDDDSHGVFQADTGQADALIVGDGGGVNFKYDQVELDVYCIDGRGSRGVAGGLNCVYIKDDTTEGEWEFALTQEGVSFGLTINGVSFASNTVVFAVGNGGEVIKLNLQ